MTDDKVIDGKKISQQIKDEVKAETSILKAEKGITPGLAFIIAGEDAASKVYVGSKAKACAELGFHSVTEKLPADVSEEHLLSLIDKFNEDKNIHGILVQLPLPKHISERKVIERISPDKDVDGFHPVNAGKLMTGEKGFVPCTPLGVTELLKRSGVETSGKNAVVLGRSNIVGKPMAALLWDKEFNCTVTVCHSGTKDLKEHTQRADIIVAAIGKANFLTADMIKEGAVIIDVGINRVYDETAGKNKITGDVDYQGCYGKCSKITPVPGGVGPMTIAMLMKNTLWSAEEKS